MTLKCWTLLGAWILVLVDGYEVEILNGKKGQVTLKAWGSDLRSVSDVNIPSNVTSIVISSTSITSLISGLFSSSNADITSLSVIRNRQLSTIDDRAFTHLSHLTELRLSRNSLNTFPHLSQSCSKLTFLDLSFNVIDKVTSHALSSCKHLKTLKLNNNKLQTLPDLSVSATSLTTLHIGYNQLSDFSQFIRGLKRLQTLVAGGNPLHSISDFRLNPRLTAFSCFPCDSLKTFDYSFVDVSTWVSLYLDLKQVSIDFMPQSILDATRKSLTYLRLEYNGSVTFPGGSLDLMEKLDNVYLHGLIFEAVPLFLRSRQSMSHLYIRESVIESYSRSSFDGFALLFTLVVSSPQLTILPDVTKSTTSIQTLSLMDGSIRDIPRSFLSKFKVIKKFLVQKCSIREVGDLGESSTLENINLDDNLISFIEVGAFSGLTNLRTISLNGNQLRTLYKVESTLLTSLYLLGNTLTCDAELMWMFDLLESNPQLRAQFYCGWPWNQLMSSMTEEHLAPPSGSYRDVGGGLYVEATLARFLVLSSSNMSVTDSVTSPTILSCARTCHRHTTCLAFSWSDRRICSLYSPPTLTTVASP